MSTQPKTGRRLPRKAAAEYLGISPATLSKWAVTGHPPLPYHKVGGRAIYDTADLDNLLDQGRREFVGEDAA